MALVKCPRCELNYILDGEKLCTVCRREVRGEPVHDDILELCSECGEHPVVPGGDLCIYCLKELARHSTVDPVSDDVIAADDSALEMDSVSTMDEIELDIDGDMEEPEFADEKESFEGEDAKDDDEEAEDE